MPKYQVKVSQSVWLEVEAESAERAKQQLEGEDDHLFDLAEEQCQDWDWEIREALRERDSCGEPVPSVMVLEQMALCPICYRNAQEVEKLMGERKE